RAAIDDEVDRFARDAGIVEKGASFGRRSVRGDPRAFLLELAEHAAKIFAESANARAETLVIPGGRHAEATLFVQHIGYPRAHRRLGRISRHAEQERSPVKRDDLDIDRL